MTTRTYKIKPLYEGQEVALPGCRTTARVVRRCADLKSYVVLWDGHEITVPRFMLAVKVLGQWEDGPRNETL